MRVLGLECNGPGCIYPSRTINLYKIFFVKGRTESDSFQVMCESDSNKRFWGSLLAGPPLLQPLQVPFEMSVGNLDPRPPAPACLLGALTASSSAQGGGGGGDGPSRSATNPGLAANCMSLSAREAEQGGGGSEGRSFLSQASRSPGLALT